MLGDIGPGDRIIPAYAGSTQGRGCRYRQGPDHPRIRGEHQIHLNSTGDIRGSSPHTRGARRRARPALVGEGIIPAYAGSTGQSPIDRAVTADHPRIRGEHPTFLDPRGQKGGSSPHTRGALDLLEILPFDDGIIPAYAGSTLPSGRLGWRASGSSPHTRGAPLSVFLSSLGGRIIPAYAGSTPDPRIVHAERSDHPRIRGEHNVRRRRGGPRCGSSPHTRGARNAPHCSRRIGTDHPRIRGEHRLQAFTARGVQGSSPHTRGARVVPDGPACRQGIIPAYAGSTRGWANGLGATWDHPRIRGEHRRGVS